MANATVAANATMAREDDDEEAEDTEGAGVPQPKLATKPLGMRTVSMMWTTPFV
eukprot:CAMPEP_0179460034 /NCGR_PEP_ID=MMETSP0799-20121207/43206_1 /TAXON_ID=46947 /ORGANISM="Geminigera cryophila, Strain CCMP2564" /LENGTH=53 /DNA_ID=CAMNT_0021262125 /DNA_START=150 /DNA_END=308 /DNA_ORIENTATION=+